MKKFRILFLLTTILLSYFVCFSQNHTNLRQYSNDLSKADIRKIFRNSLKEDEMNYMWYTCNDDSTYSIRDTLIMYNNINYLYHSNNCCHFVGWHFIKTHFFRLSNMLLCQEPPIEEGSLKLYRIKLKKIKRQLFFLTFDDKTRIDSYKVIDLTTIKLCENGGYCLCPVLTIVRNDPTAGAF